MVDEIRSREQQLRIPLQVAPISRTATGAALVGETSGVVAAANWCERLGLAPQVCDLLSGGGGTGPTMPTY
jgi:hypothetical protein